MIDPSVVSKDIKRLKTIFKTESARVNEFPNISDETLERFSLVFNDYIEKLDLIEEMAWKNYCYKNAYLFQNKLNKTNDLIIHTIKMIELVAKTLVIVNDEIIENGNVEVINSILADAINKRDNLEKNMI